MKEKAIENLTKLFRDELEKKLPEEFDEYYVSNLSCGSCINICLRKDGFSKVIQIYLR